ncbi:MAG: hypothetical protein B6D59_01015 [Campylobacteraceae bacterium 4484_4]|nr:MAG: hypothetical protein B6D59_01015 [Campylobacteraceae bacterium 4484_4]
MREILEYFGKITKIPHCSKNAQKLAAFIKEEARRAGCRVREDDAGNILAQKGDPRLCLQAHYDMVCVGKAPEIEIVEKEGYLSAKESTLGADNGIGVAMALHFLHAHNNLEALFTADEEVGLIGASRLSLMPASKRLLNLDSEEEGEIFIGCAGAVEIYAEKMIQRRPLEASERLYEISVRDLPGGHSGVDIDKNIPNAIKELVALLMPLEIELVSIEGGEADNAIPRHAAAIVASKEELPAKLEGATIRELQKDKRGVMREGKKLLSMLHCFAHGVRAYDTKMEIVLTSINLAMIRTKEESLEVTLFPRSMENLLLERIRSETAACFEAQGFELHYAHPSPAWRPEITPFAKEVLEVTKEAFPNASFKAIHAGLECGVIHDRFPHLEAVSIGPNIDNPHSLRERVEIASVERVARIVERLLQRL